MATQAIDVPKKPAESVALERVAPTPMDLLQIATSQGADIEKLAKLMELHERWEANEARKAFVQAMNAFKAATPILEKVKKVDFSSKSGNSRVQYNYAPLDHVSKVLGEALSRHGLSFRWNVVQGDTGVSVTCVLQHCDGHSEKVSLSSGLHNDDRMNPIQRLASTITYLERYTLLAATGMATQEQDNDGNNGGSSGASMSDERFVELQDWIAAAATQEELKKAYQQACKEADAIGDQEAKRQFNQWKNKRYKELYTQGAK